MTQIRKVRYDEAEEVLKLWNEDCLEAAGRALSDEEARGVLEALKRYASHQEAFCLVAETPTGLIGFLTALITSHPIFAGLAGEIEELYVQPAMRRSGTASQLVSHAVSLLRQAGAATIRVHACAESQTASDFWQHLGWEHDLTTYSLYEG